jgi:hypothetical protein
MERRAHVWVLIAAHSFRASNDHCVKSAVGSEDANAAERGGRQYVYVDRYTSWSTRSSSAFVSLQFLLLSYAHKLLALKVKDLCEGRVWSFNVRRNA